MQVQEGCKNYYVLRRNYLTDNFCTGETTRRRGRRYLHKAVRYAGLFFWGCRVFFCFQVSFCPVKRGNRAGSSQNEFDYSPRSTQTSLPFLDCRSCENFGLAHFSIFFLQKKSSSEPSFRSTVGFLTTQLENELVRNSRNCDCREAENWSRYLSESSQTHSEKRRLDFLASRGEN